MKKLRKNIVLIGMPGCGKTTIGRELAKKMGIEFSDIDECIVKTTNKSIDTLFQNGEEYFRKIESFIIKQVSIEYPKVISSGGGSVIKYENIVELKKRGIIIFINRSVEDISGDITLNNRPLLKKGIKELKKLYNKRYLLYKKYCDYEVLNTNLNNCIEEICNYINKNS